MATTPFKLKLVQAGYTNFTGLLGNAMHFTNGLSDLAMSEETAAGIANIYQCDRVLASDSTTDTGRDDTTDPSVTFKDETGDFNADTHAAPANDVGTA